MIPINNSDTAWLIVSDYNQEHSLPYIELRQDIISPDVNDWSPEQTNVNKHFGPTYGDVVGFLSDTVGYGETELPETVGDYVRNVIWVIRAPTGMYVGGHRKFDLL
jgi:hypothetical protein